MHCRPCGLSYNGVCLYLYQQEPSFSVIFGVKFTFAIPIKLHSPLALLGKVFLQ